MKRITLLLVLLACGLAGTSTPAFAQAGDVQTAPLPVTGKIDLLLIGRDNVGSSKFEEYRTVPKGMSLPALTLQGSRKGIDFSLFGSTISRVDQRYTGRMDVQWMGVKFDYNQIGHDIGNHAHSILSQVSPGVWTMSSTLRGALANAVDAQLPTTTRTYPFYSNLFAPMISAANVLDLSSVRRQGNVEFDLGRQLPFDLRATYMRDLKTGSRGAGGGVIYSAVNSIVELPEALNEVTQDIGLRAALNRTWGNVHAAYGHNWYNNRQETTVFDNPLRPSDLAYVSASVPGGPGSGRLIGPPDNSADNGSAGVMLKFAKQTRISADAAFGQWNQNANFYPYTINSTVLTSAGLRADSVEALDKRSLEGKIDTTMFNFGFTSRPITGLGVRMRYRYYDMANKTPTFKRTGSVGSAPDRSWTAVNYASSSTPEFGYETASPYGSTTGRFDLQASYDVSYLTVEGTFRNSQIDRTYREATKGAESGGSFAVILNARDWVRFRGMFDRAHRTASGYDAATSIGLQADESERQSRRVGIDMELEPNDQVTFLVAYVRRHDDYPNRPNRAPGVDGTSNGLLRANYDSYTAEADWTPGGRGDFGLYYTYEKNLSTTRYGGTGSSAAAPYTPLMSMLTFDGSDKTNTFGVFANCVLKPEKLSMTLNVQRQKLDGNMGITGDPGGSFALARAAYGGIQDITDYNDTNLQTVNLQLDYLTAKSWMISFGYLYEKYTFADAYSIFGDMTNAGQFDVGNENFPASGGFYLKGNDGDYKVGVGYVKLSYRF